MYLHYFSSRPTPCPLNCRHHCFVHCFVLSTAYTTSTVIKKKPVTIKSMIPCTTVHCPLTIVSVSTVVGGTAFGLDSCLILLLARTRCPIDPLTLLSNACAIARSTASLKTFLSTARVVYRPTVTSSGNSARSPFPTSSGVSWCLGLVLLHQRQLTRCHHRPSYVLSPRSPICDTSRRMNLTHPRQPCACV